MNHVFTDHWIPGLGTYISETGQPKSYSGSLQKDTRSLNDWQDYIDNPEIGKIAFQFGTRPMITKESPISDAWKKVMLTLKNGDVILQKFSPKGFFSSAIKNTFLERLMARKDGARGTYC